MTATMTSCVSLTTMECCECGLVFALPESMRARFKREGGSFYCPSGHRQRYTTNEVERLRALLDEANRTNTQLAAEYATLQRENTRVVRRVSAGVCPCCNRTFQDLARHMATKHKSP